MIDYVRPPIVIEEFLDDEGLPIPYGSRWLDNDRDGPEDTYSVTRHPERFQPLVEVLHAIIEHLVTMYDVDRREVAPSTVVVRPIDPSAAPITFEFAPFPSVKVTGGTSARLDVMCGCDHCDEGVLDLVDDIEESISAVVAGQLTEWPDGYELRHADGSEWQTQEGQPGRTSAPKVVYQPWRLRGEG